MTPSTVSVIIPTHNDSPLVESTIAHIKNTSQEENTEIIVIDSSEVSHPCRACQMHAGATQAKNDILLFLHADTKLPDNWHQSLLTAWNKPKPPALTAFRLGFNKRSLYYRLMAWLADIRTSWITHVPHGDQALAIDRWTYRAVDGFSHTPLMEEYVFCQKLKKLGKPILLPEKVETSARRYESVGPFFGNVRNLFIIVMFYLGISPEKLKKLYR